MDSNVQADDVTSPEVNAQGHGDVSAPRRADVGVANFSADTDKGEGVSIRSVRTTPGDLEGQTDGKGTPDSPEDSKGKTVCGYATHPALELFPMLEGQELQDLADDIKANGLRNPVLLVSVENDECILVDGRSRLRACEMVCVTPLFKVWRPFGTNGSVTAYVVSQNLRRRHLDASQRAMVAQGLTPLFEAEARARKAATQFGAPVGANLREPGGDAECTETTADSGKAAGRAAKVVNVSTRSVELARKVARKCVPELVDAVRRGTVAVSAAAAIADEPPEVQRAAVKGGLMGVRECAKSVRDRRRSAATVVAERKRRQGGRGEGNRWRSLEVDVLDSDVQAACRELAGLGWKRVSDRKWKRPHKPTLEVVQ